MVKNRRGWIRIVEAFVAILLVMGILLIIVGDDFTQREEDSEKIYEIQLAVLRDIQVNDDLRAEILSSSGEIPVNVQEKIDARMPNYLEWEAHICGIEEECDANDLPDKSIYVRSVFISDPEGDNSKQLKLFCWEK